MIDAHTHVWTIDPERYPWQPTLGHVPVPTEPATAEQLLGEMDAAGVELAVLVQPSVYGWDNSYLCDAIAAHPGRFTGVCLVDRTDPAAPAHLREWHARGCTGFRLNLINEPDAGWLLDPVLEPLWDAAADTGMSMSAQMRPVHAAVVGELARRRDDLNVIVDYLGPEAFHDSTGISAVRDLALAPNTWYKLLALGTDSRESFPFRDIWPLYRAALDAFGPERLVFGTDFPHVYRCMTYAEGAAWPAQLDFLSDADRNAICDQNPRSLWGFAPTRGAAQ